MLGITKEVSGDFEDVVERVREALKEEGFGILCEIDVKETLKQKIGVDFDDYIILGACNPPYAHSVLEESKEFGLLLPCNVVVYRDGEKVYVSTIRPTALAGFSENEVIRNVAGEVEEKLRRVVESI
jgi:uncharacterized protein (DUF302 family)